MEMLDGITENDFISELYGPEDDITSSIANRWYIEDSVLMRGLRLEEEKLKAILNSTDKPVFVIPGNHDRTAWKSEKNMLNIHTKSARLGRYNFVGYRYCLLDKTESEMENDLSVIKGLL